MKYIAIILLSFIITTPALAAKEVQGTVPVIPPLQPPTAGVAPSYSSNAENYDPTRTVSNSGADSSSDSSTTGQVDHGGILGSTGSKAGTIPNPWPAIIVLILGGVGVLGY